MVRPADYQGRVRSFAHAHGNWATCIFAELKRPLLEDLAVLQTRLHQAANSDDIKIQPELHLSLSRTVTFPIHWIEPFLQRMSKEVGLKVPSRFPLFWSQELQVFVNDEKTRTFVGLCIEHSDSPLKKIVEIIDKEFASVVTGTFLVYVLPFFHESAATASFKDFKPLMNCFVKLWVAKILTGSLFSTCDHTI